MFKNSNTKPTISELNDNFSQYAYQDLICKDSNADQSKKIVENKRKLKSVHWGMIEQQKYLKFLVEQRDLFELDSDRRRVVGIHVRMAKVIESRSAAQCRSHHQKMLMKYKNIDNIIDSNSHLFTHQEALKKVTFEEKAVSQKSSQKTQEKMEDFFTFDSIPENQEESYFFQSEMKEVQSNPFLVTFFSDIC